jgi:hypothetical protein
MKRLLHFSALALAGLFLAGTTARAGNIDWQYNWDRTPAAVLADAPGTGGVSFTNEPTKNATNSSDVVASNLKVFSSATPDTPDKLSTNGGYTLTLTLTDVASGKSGVLTWNGKLTGTFSASSSNIANAFLSPLTQFLSLGNNTYTVTIGPYSPPGPPTASNSGSIAAHVEVSTSVVTKTPEPTSMLLCLLGASFVGANSWRKRRQVALAI